MKESERKKEIDARIVRDNPKPISIGNGVHREENKLAQKEENDETLKRAKTEERHIEDTDDSAMDAGTMERGK